MLWSAAALCLLAMPVFGSRRFYTRTSLPVIDGWVFLAAATGLCILGAIIDVL